MGVDFLERTARTFERSTLRGRKALEEERLFSRAVTPPVWVYTACPVDNYRFEVDDEYIAESRNGRVVLFQGHEAVACIKEPPAQLIESMMSVGPSIAVVQNVYRMSGNANVVLK